MTDIPKPHTPRRAKGEGGLFPFQFRGKTRYRATQSETVPFMDNDGNPQTKKKLVTGTGDTEAEARLRLRDNLRKFYSLSAEQKVQNRRNPDTVTTYYYDVWLKSKRATDWRTHVLRGVRQRIEQHVLPDIGNISLVALQRDDVRKLFSSTLPAKGLESSTLVNVWRNLHTLLGDAVYDTKIARNPMDAIRKSERPQKKKPIPFIIPPRIVTTVQQKVEGTPEEPLRMLSLLLGLRIAELLGLTWDKVHIDDGVNLIEIHQQLKPIDIPHGDGCRRDLTTGKFSCGKSAQKCPRHTAAPTNTGLAIFPYVKTTPRNVTLVEPLLTLLKQQRERQKVWKAKPDWEPIPRPKMDDLVFTTETGRPLRQQAVGAEWRQLLTDCGFSALNQHKSRHIAITALILNNTPLSVIGSIVGHADSRVTEQVYAQINERDQKEHLERLGRSYDRDAVKREAEEKERVWREATAGRLALAQMRSEQESSEGTARLNAVSDVVRLLEIEGKNIVASKLDDIMLAGYPANSAWVEAVAYAAENGVVLEVAADDGDNFQELIDEQREAQIADLDSIDALRKQ